MAVAVTCPECDDSYEVSDEAAKQMVRCRRCQCPIEPARREEAIQVKPVLTSHPRQRTDDEPLPTRSRPHVTAKAAFPWTAVLVIILGLMLFVLMFSIGFNIWFLTKQDNPVIIRNDQIRLQQEQVARQQAEQNAAQAAAAQQEAQRKEAAVRRELEDGRREQELAKARRDEIQKELEQVKRDLGRTKENLAAAREFGAKLAPRGNGPEDWGSLEGRVVYKGELPKVESLEARIRNHADKMHLLKAPADEMLDPTWRIDPKTRGVANVAVFIKRPKDRLLPIHADDKVRKDAVVLDSPFAAYVPHMAALYPEWNDGRDHAETGQRFIIKNSSTLARNARVTGLLPENNVFNKNFPPGTEATLQLHPQQLPVSVSCDTHPWMRAHVWVFDHPYFAITKADGTFVIPRVPAGMEVQVMAWHEAQGWLFTKEGRTMTLQKGKNTLDFEMSAK